jgi:hypothetical protein
MPPFGAADASDENTGENGGDALAAFVRQQAIRTLNDGLRFWTACASPRCRRHRRCCGTADACLALFWPAVPDDLKAWCRAMGEAKRDGCSLGQALRHARGEADGRRRQWHRPAV